MPINFSKLKFIRSLQNYIYKKINFIFFLLYLFYMKKLIFTLIFACVSTYMYAQEGLLDRDMLNRQKTYNNLADALKESYNVYKLSLTGVNIPTFLKEVSKFRYLQELHFEGNNLTTLPKEIMAIPNLQILNLNGNKLTVLPKEIGNMKNLQILYLSNNQLTSLPEEIANLEGLVLLDIKNNKLTSLPRYFGLLSNLKFLTVTQNNIFEKDLKLARRALPNCQFQL